MRMKDAQNLEHITFHAVGDEQRGTQFAQQRVTTAYHIANFPYPLSVVLRAFSLRMV
ncbi:hypothetical protein [Pectobacterium parvum]|uniref:hypothetical protein n=1 Tax=Pectobacterium parvum TaxID=2778550 RepID=UPI0015F26536|nr:hypothetical protein [Pectobacterium parvum]